MTDIQDPVAPPPPLPNSTSRAGHSRCSRHSASRYSTRGVTQRRLDEHVRQC